MRTVLIVISALVLLLSLGSAITAQTPQPGVTPEITAESAPSADGIPAPLATRLPEGAVLTRTPEPTATPGLIVEGVSKVTEVSGLAGESFLGLPVEDWINLGISLLIVLAGYLVGTWLIRRVLPRVVRRTGTKLDDHLLQAIGPDLRWLVVVLALEFATRQLGFLSPEIKALLADAYFVLALVMVTRITWRLIDLADEWYRRRLAEEERLESLDAVLTLLVRLGRAVVVVVAISILLTHFGVNITAFAAALAVAGLALALAAKDVVADAIEGFIILVDQPVRIGDRIEIREVGTWGDVTEIGLRTTRIRTRDNRVVIVPNSVIGANQVINYSYPDPRYRIQTHVGIAYGSDIEVARRIIVDTVRQVEGVLPEEPVDVLYIEMGDSARILRVRWWIVSYVDTRQVLDRVHTAVERALNEAGIEMPFPTQSISLELAPETAKLLPQVLERSHPERGSAQEGVVKGR
jgi:small-conductance mechanosensitive channel